MALHCLYCDPGAPPALRLRAQLADGDAVLLLGQAASLARRSHPDLPPWVGTQVPLYVLAEDLAVLGITASAPSVTVLDYAGWVALTEVHNTQMVWR